MDLEIFIEKFVTGLNQNMHTTFDPEIYLAFNQDVKRDGVDPLWHYNNLGLKEGRVNQFTRHNLINMLPRSASYLEIGPLGRPYLSKKEFNVKYFDVLNRNDLINKAKEAEGHHPEDVPEIDFVDANGDLSFINEKFDIVFSSHCIEHQPNILGHLQQVSRLIKDTGLYICIIPDFRYSFDHFRAPSNIVEVIKAFVDNRKVHTRENLLLGTYMATHNDACKHWAGDHGSCTLSKVDVKRILKSLSIQSMNYEDTHAWFFSPNNFREVFDTEVNELTAMRLVLCHDTPINTHEFVAIFMP